MGLTNFEQMLVDSNGNAYGVSGSMPLPVGAIGQLVAGVNPNTNIVEYLNSISGSLLVTGSVNANVTFPADIVVSPASPSGFWSAGPMGVTGSVNVYTSGPQEVSGTVSIVQPVEVWQQGTVGVSASVALPVFNQGTVGVSGTVSIVRPVQVWNPGPIGVSGTIHTGSTANGYPVTIGGVYYGSGNVGSLPAYVQSMQVDPSGAVYITTTGSLPVYIAGGMITANVPQPLEVWQSGPVGVSASVNLPVWQTGVVGVSGTVSVSNFPANQQVWTAGPVGVSASVQLPVYSTGPVGVTASANIPVWQTGIVGVSGTVSVTQPVEVWQQGLVGVTGSYQSGSVATAPIFPVLEGGLDTTNTVRPFLTDPQGRLTNPTTGSNVTTVAATTGNVTVLGPNAQRVGIIFFNEGSSTCVLKFGANATQSSYSVQLASKAYYELPFTYQGRIDATFSTNTGNL